MSSPSFSFNNDTFDASMNRHLSKNLLDFAVAIMTAEQAKNGGRIPYGGLKKMVASLKRKNVDTTEEAL